MPVAKGPRGNATPTPTAPPPTVKRVEFKGPSTQTTGGESRTTAVALAAARRHTGPPTSGNGPVESGVGTPYKGNPIVYGEPQPIRKVALPPSSRGGSRPTGVQKAAVTRIRNTRGVIN